MKPKQKIEFYEIRRFSEKLNATFAYIGQNFRSLFLSIVTIGGPPVLLISLMTSVALERYLSSFGQWDPVYQPSPFEDPELLFGANWIPMLVVVGLFFLVLSIAAYVLIMTAVYSHMKIYNESSEVRDIPVKEVWERVKIEFWGFLGSITLTLVVVYLILALAAFIVLLPLIMMDSIAFGFLGFIAIFFMIFMAFAITYLAPVVRFYEDIDVGTMFRRAWFLLRGKWLSTIGLIIVSGFIASIIGYVFQIPMQTISFADLLHDINEPGMEISEKNVGKTVLTIFASMIAFVGSYLVNTIPTIAIAFQYFTLVETKESRGLMERIEEVGNREVKDQEDEDY